MSVIVFVVLGIFIDVFFGFSCGLALAIIENA